MKSAARNNQKIKVIGRGHSRSAIAQSDGVLVSLHNFTGLVGVDLQKKRATVRTGTTLRALNGYLDEFGLALGNLPAVADQTIGGAISIGLLRLLFGFKLIEMTKMYSHLILHYRLLVYNSLVPRLYFPAFFLRAKKSWEVEPGNEARYTKQHN